MPSPIGVYRSLTAFFGLRRRFVHRVAGLCLIFLGVHAAADLIDDVVFRLVDAVDLAIDSLVWGFFDWLASIGGLSPEAAQTSAQGFAEWLDLDEKDKLAKVLALLVELGVDLALFDFAWGKRVSTPEEETRVGLREELVESARELAEALWPLDLERLSVPLILFAFAASGAFVASVALEGAVAGVLTEVAPLFRPGATLAAWAGVLAAGLLVWRFVPDLLHGGILRAHERGARLAARNEAEREAAPTSKLAALRRGLRRARRGLLLFAVVLPLAVVSVTTQATFFSLLMRAGGGF